MVGTKCKPNMLSTEASPSQTLPFNIATLQAMLDVVHFKHFANFIKL